MENIKIISFDTRFSRDNFICTSNELTRYLQNQVSQDIKRRITACFLAIDTQEQILGYYTLSATSIPLLNLPMEYQKKLPRYPSIPAVLMGRLAVAEKTMGKGLGGILLVDALIRSAASEIAAHAMVVEAKDIKSKQFYQHFGFQNFQHNSQKLFLPLQHFKNFI